MLVIPQRQIKRGNMTLDKRILYFEGAGCSKADVSKATIGNCRIRTAFHLDNGQSVYLEIVASERPKQQCRGVGIHPWEYTGFVVSCHYITDDRPNDDENKHRIRLPENKRVFEYTEKSILKFVNWLGCSFDEVRVVPELGGFRVFRKNTGVGGLNTYNYGDEFRFDPEMTARRITVYDRVNEIEKAEKRYPNFALWVDAKDSGLLHLIRHFSGYNRHWTIRTDVDDWMTTAVETRLGRYGC